MKTFTVTRNINDEPQTHKEYKEGLRLMEKVGAESFTYDEGTCWFDFTGGASKFSKCLKKVLSDKSVGTVIIQVNNSMCHCCIMTCVDKIKDYEKVVDISATYDSQRLIDSFKKHPDWQTTPVFK